MQLADRWSGWIIPFTLFVVSLSSLALTSSLAATERINEPESRPSSVTREMLDAKINEVESSADLQDEAKNKLIESYRKALSNLEAKSAASARIAAYEEATRTAPTQTQLIREKIEAVKRTDPLAKLDISLEAPLEQIDRQLKKEQADLAAVDARRSDFEERLAHAENRPAAIRQRLPEATQQQQEITAELQAPPETDASLAMTKARRWVLETRYAALSAEINKLNQELLSQPMRVDLLKAKRDKEVNSVDWIGQRVRVLNELVNHKRQLEAEQAKIAAEEAQRETIGMDPLLILLAKQNAELTNELQSMAVRLDALDREQEQADSLARRIEADYQDAKATLETGGLTEGLGQLLLEHRQSLPDFKDYTRKANTRRQQITAVGVRRLHHREEARRIADLEQTVVELEAQVTADITTQLHDKIRELVAQRQILLEKALKEEEFYLRQLREVDVAERKLLDVSHLYDDFLSEHLWWLRSEDRAYLDDLKKLPEEMERLLSLAIWSDMLEILSDQIAQSPVAWLTLLFATILLWKRRALITAIESTSKRLGKPTTDRFFYTFRALVLTLLVAAPLPLLLALIGWQLQVAVQGTDISQAVGFTLFRGSLHLYLLRALRMLCIPKGLAIAHFRWLKSSVRCLSVELGWLTWVFVPAALVLRLSIDLNPLQTGGMVTILTFFIFCATLVIFFYRVFHPRRGVLVHLLFRRDTGMLLRAYPLWYPLLLATPLGLVILVLSGYIYSAASLSFMLLYTVWMILGLVVLRALAMRWLLIVRRRLAYEAAMERRQAELAVKQAKSSASGDEEDYSMEFEEPEVNLEALSDDSRELVKVLVIFAGLISLYLIWSDLLPALRIFDEVSLWQHTVSVDGEDKQLPITLADIGLALVYALATAVLAKRLPGVQEIILLQRFNMSSSGRYTVTKLSTYAIVSIGILLVFNTLGAHWSQLQWLVAALGVGIGFGLQEIVANFISGLIILFERPIRVGDFVSVGDTDGIVTRIRIRATTIRNLDGKELLVPNKEFVTGHLLNWSLSDQTTRILISVGIAYGSDVRKAMRLLEEAAREHEEVLNDPAPSVIFENFGDNALGLVLRCFVDAVDVRYSTISALNQAVNDKFNEAGITIAFPQRDLHLDTLEPLRINIEDAR